jgi:hypothetical protein
VKANFLQGIMDSLLFELGTAEAIYRGPGGRAFNEMSGLNARRSSSLRSFSSSSKRYYEASIARGVSMLLNLLLTFLFVRRMITV